MTTTKPTRNLAIVALLFSLAAACPAARVSFSTRAPATGPGDIANLTGATEAEANVTDGDHDATYIADDRPVQGQTFTAGTNATGYLLRAVTLREVKYETYALVPDLKYTVRITKPSGNTLEVIATETAEVAESAPGNFSTISGGGEMGVGSGAFITFTFDKPVALKPNTVYGFDVGGGDTRHYWQTDGTATDAYAGGEAYSSGLAGVGKDARRTRRGDHVFVVTLAPAGPATSAQAKASTENSPSGKP